MCPYLSLGLSSGSILSSREMSFLTTYSACIRFGVPQSAEMPTSIPALAQREGQQAEYATMGAGVFQM